MTGWTDEDHLLFDLAFALSKIKTKPRGPERDDIYRKMVAQQIIDHLKLAGWSFARGPSQPSHG